MLSEKPATGWMDSPLMLALVKATLGAAVLGGLFLVLPGHWNARITLMVAGGFWGVTFVLSLVTSWAKARVMAHFAAQEPGGPAI